MALGHEIRTEILHQLVEYERIHRGPIGLSFTELRQRVGVEDPSKFNYHLKQLRGPFIEKVDEEYRLNNAGRHVVSAIHSGAFTLSTRRHTTEIDIGCPKCESPLSATYESESFTVDCPTHGKIGRLPLPPSIVLNRPVTQLFHAAAACGDRYLKAVRDGICPICWDKIEMTVPVRETPDFSEASAYACIEDRRLARFSCTGCWMTMYAPIGACVVQHPAVVTFFFNIGVNLSEKSIFEIDFIWSDDTAIQCSNNPKQIKVDINRGGEQLHLVLDYRTNVVDFDCSI